MNKNALLAIAIVSLNSLCYGMFNSHMPATNQIAQEMHNRAIRNAEIQRQQQQTIRQNEILRQRQQEIKNAEIQRQQQK